MIKTNQKYFNWLNRLSDLAIMYAAYAGAVWFWIFHMENSRNNIAVKYVYPNIVPTLVVLFCFVAVFQFMGLYDSFRYRGFAKELVILTKALLLCAVMQQTVFFVLKLNDFSRGVIYSFFGFSFILLAVKRAILRAALRLMRRNGMNHKHVLLVGNGRLAEKFVQSIERNPEFGFECIGYVGHEPSPGLENYLGRIDKLPEILQRYEPDEVISALETEEMDVLKEVIIDCQDEGVRLSIMPVYNDYLPPCATVDVLDNVRLINVRGISQDLAVNKVLKRGFDIIFSALVLLVLSPLMLLVALGVKLSSPGPVLFKQVRVGKDRKTFTMYKFRSMVVNDASDTAWSRRCDSRTTPFGALIRKLSIDELPQFFNVLRGDMSVVGPRPELPYYVEQYRHTVPLYMVKHQIKPGITGWAQVNGLRGDTSIEKRIEYDIWYIDNWSIYLDIKIIFKTIFGGLINKEQSLKSAEREEQTV